MANDDSSMLTPNWALDLSDQESAELELCQCGDNASAIQFFSETHVDGNNNTINNILVLGYPCPECGKPQVS